MPWYTISCYKKKQTCVNYVSFVLLVMFTFDNDKYRFQSVLFVELFHADEKEYYVYIMVLQK
jgi:hypothetical protein